MPSRRRASSRNAGRRVFRIAVVVLVLVVAVVLWWEIGRPRARQASARQTAVGEHKRVDTTAAAVVVSDDSLQPLLPNPTRTPGATLDVTAADICVPGYSRKVRNVPAGVKRAVYLSYGIANPRPRRYEVDHLISLELGGSNSARNLWPQSYETTPWNARVKDALENELHRRVCAGTLDLPTAQRDIAMDWIAAYKKYFRTNRPLRRKRG